MTCREIETILPGYLDRGLSPDEERRVAEHLAACPGCRATLDELARTVKLVKGLAEQAPPDWLKTRIMDQVRAEAKATKAPAWVRRLCFPRAVKIPLQALATVLVAVFAFYLYHVSTPEQILPGVHKKSAEQYAPAPLAEPAPAPEAAPAPEGEPRAPQAPVRGAAKRLVPDAESRSAPAPAGQGRPRPAALFEMAQPQGNAPAPAPAAPAATRDQEAMTLKEEKAAGDKLAKARAPSLGMSAPEAAPRAAAAQDATPPMLIVAVTDMRPARQALEKKVRELHGRITLVEETPTTAVLRILVQPDQVQTLMATVAQLGTPGMPPPAFTPGTDRVTVRLELQPAR